jgi:hypothetical protein
VLIHSGYEDGRPRCSDSPPPPSAPPQSSGESSLNPHQEPPLIIRWCGKGGFADRKCTLDDTLDRWFDNRFPPLSIYHGGRDYLVLAEPLLERMRVKEKDVNVIKVTKLDLSEVSQVPERLVSLRSACNYRHPISSPIECSRKERWVSSYPLRSMT